jgi:hypothetical protein
MFIIRIFTGSIIGMISGLIFGAFLLMLVFAGLLVALAATGGPGSCTPGGGPTTIDAANAAGFRGKWNVLSAALDGGAAVQPLPALKLVGEFRHQDAVLADQADQCHQADLGINIYGCRAQEQRDQRPADGHRHADHDDQRVAQALELGGQYQVDDDEGEDERDRELVARAFPATSDGALDEDAAAAVLKELARYRALAIRPNLDHARGADVRAAATAWRAARARTR